jgi:glycosyltransferase involved in cell wall biosynthesis
MKVLLCHTSYTQRGGEDRSFEEERELLIANGCRVVEYVRRNDAMHEMGSLKALATTMWNREAARELAAMVRREQPDVVHCTNTFPLLSPAVCRAASQAGAAVVQALRNYRLLCANSYLMRDSRPCEDCIGKAIPWPALVHRCYRASAPATAAVVAMQVLHRALGTWKRHVDAFFTLTDFARQKFVDAGFPADRVHVKHNSVYPDPGMVKGTGRYFAFAARLGPEKGVATLLEAWRRNLELPPLKIIGDGPLADSVVAAAQADPRIEYLGRLSEGDVHRVFGDAMAVIVPSIWYETFGRTIAEAYAVGTPVIASRLGAMCELVEDGQTGWQFEAGNAAALSAIVSRVAALLPAERGVIRRAARDRYDECFTPQANYARLMQIYEMAVAHARGRLPERTTAADGRPRTALAAVGAVKGG